MMMVYREQWPKPRVILLQIRRSLPNVPRPEERGALAGIFRATRLDCSRSASAIVHGPAGKVCTRLGAPGAGLLPSGTMPPTTAESLAERAFVQARPGRLLALNDRPPFSGRPSLTGHCGHCWTCSLPRPTPRRPIIAASNAVIRGITGITVRRPSQAFFRHGVIPGSSQTKAQGISSPGTDEASLMRPRNDGERQWNIMLDWTCR